MGDVVIRVEGLGKRYRIGGPSVPTHNFREALTATVLAPFRRLGYSLRRQDQAAEETIWALKDISFEIKRGEAVGVIGRNGAGKSTLLKILSRITEPTEGRVRIKGRVGSLLEVGSGFHHELTGRENIYLNGAILGMRKAEIDERFDEIVAFAEIDRFLDTPVKHYSTGMYMRLAFAVAAHLNPEILLVDEVLAVGDAAFQRKCLGRMGEAATEGRTVLLVSHNLEAIRRLCRKTVLLESGRLRAFDETERALRLYLESDALRSPTFEVQPPRERDGPGLVTRLGVEDLEGHPISGLKAGQYWQIRLAFIIRRPLDHFIVGIGLRTELGTPLWTTWSSPQWIEPGDYEVVARNDSVRLAAGVYPIVVGLSTFERTFHYAPSAGHLRVDGVSEGIDALRVQGAGVVLNRMEFSLRRVGSARS
jgi:lipopolysaccharide transport system ATP-binding protein